MFRSSCLRISTTNTEDRENVYEFYTRLQLLARKCEFSNVDIEVKRQIIQGTSSLRLTGKAIEQSLSLEDLLKSARAMETANEQTNEIEKQQLHAFLKRAIVIIVKNIHLSWVPKSRPN